MIDDDHMYNVLVSKHINNNALDNEIYFEVEGIKSHMNNETFNAELELDNLSENGTINVGRYNSDFEIITPKMQSLLGNLGLNQSESQLYQKFCLHDKDKPPPPAKLVK